MTLSELQSDGISSSKTICSSSKSTLSLSSTSSRSPSDPSDYKSDFFMLVFNFLVTTNMLASFKILKSSMSSVLMVWTVTKWSRRASLVSKRTSLQNLHFQPKINYFQKNRCEIFIWWKLNILKKLVKLPFPLCLPILWIRQDSFLMKTVSQSKHEYDFLNLGLVM